MFFSTKMKDFIFFIFLCALFFLFFAKYIIYWFFFSVPAYFLIVIWGGVQLSQKKKWTIIQRLCVSFPIGIALVFISLHFWSVLNTDHYIYKIGIDVSTPKGLITSSNIVEVTNSTLPHTVMGLGWGGEKIKGEAVFCDLGEDRGLIGLLSYQKRCFPSPLKYLPWICAGYDLKPAMRGLPFIYGRYSVNKKCWPMMVYMSNYNDYTTIEEINNNLSLYCGDGYVIEDVWVEMVDGSDELFSIASKLAWLDFKSTEERVNAFSFMKLKGLPYRSNVFVMQ